MNVLIIGGGGREHALAWKVAQSGRVKNVFVAPGNAGTASEGKCRNVAVKATDIDGLLALAQSEGVALTVVGPEVPLVAGVVDRFRAAGLRIFGPTAAAAQLEGSKAYAKDFLARHGIPTAFYAVHSEVDAALAYVRDKGAPIVIKADVQGSAEALAAAVEKMPAGAVKLRVMHTGVGGITETDVLLAAASKAIVIGFNIRPEPKAASLAEREGVDVRLYSIIYDALNDIRAAMEGLLEPTLKERVLGRVEVRQMFTIPKAGLVAGCYVVDGVISRASAGVRVIRDSVVVYEGKLGSLRRFKDDVREVQQGYECGVTVENFNDLKAGDIIEAFAIDKVAAKLEPVNRGAAPSHRA